ncbi:MAG: glycosyltransferase family 4 protein [Euryarchaeota archaeon]|nr:glycosyltransferase family 4 protein [Euryarchaeota archaeon]
MRILATTPYYEPEGGGLERYAHAVLRRLAARGHTVEVIAFTKGEEGDEVLDGVPVHRVRTRLRLGNTPLDPGFFTKVRRRIRAFGPDLMVAHTPVPFPAEMAYLAARKEGIPFVTTYHAGRLLGSAPHLQAFAALDRVTFERAMLGGSAGIVAVSPFVRDNALAAHKERTCIVPPGVDRSVFSPGGRSDGRTILFAGPLSRSYSWKGLDVLLEAFRIVKVRMPDARLMLVGEGDRMQELERFAEEVGDVSLPGRLPEQGLVEAYRGSAVTVLPSTSDAESFGMVLAEANACGRPVVGSRIGGIPYLVRHGDNGLLAAPGDPVDLAERILEVLSDPEEATRMGARGRHRIAADHDWDRLTSATEEVLEDAVRA